MIAKMDTYKSAMDEMKQVEFTLGDNNREEREINWLFGQQE